MSSHYGRLDEALDEAAKVLSDPRFAADPLLPAYRALAQSYEHSMRNFMKTLRISDRYQLRLKELNEALDQAMRTDYLTGLLNRRAFFDRVEEERSRSRRHGGKICILMADIDDFKVVNDRFGHDAGDAVLVATTRAIVAGLRHEDLKVRWGGEEFLALLPETSLQGALAAAEKLRSLVAETVTEAKGERISLTLSIGVAEDLADSIEEAIRAADQALLEAKRLGKNRTVLQGEVGRILPGPETGFPSPRCGEAG